MIIALPFTVKITFLAWLVKIDFWNITITIYEWPQNLEEMAGWMGRKYGVDGIEMGNRYWPYQTWVHLIMSLLMAVFSERNQNNNSTLLSYATWHLKTMTYEIFWDLKCDNSCSRGLLRSQERLRHRGLTQWPRGGYNYFFKFVI